MIWITNRWACILFKTCKKKLASRLSWKKMSRNKKLLTKYMNRVSRKPKLTFKKCMNRDSKIKDKAE